MVLHLEYVAYAISCAELLHVLMLSTSSSRRPGQGTLRYPRESPSAEALIDREEDRTLRAALVGMLRETYRADVRELHPEPAPHDEPSV
jgi:hypothetical protein